MYAVTRRADKPGRDEFVLGSELGRGNYSTVYRALHRATGEVFALKVVDKGRVQRLQHRHKNIQNEILMERNLLRRLRHPNVIHLFHTFQVHLAAAVWPGEGRSQARGRGPTTHPLPPYPPRTRPICTFCSSTRPAGSYSTAWRRVGRPWACTGRWRGTSPPKCCSRSPTSTPKASFTGARPNFAPWLDCASIQPGGGACNAVGAR